MKKLVFVFMMVLISIGASAQFVGFEPSGVVPQNVYTPDYGYGVPYVGFETVGQIRQRQAQPKMEQFTTTGYYKDYNGWHSMPIRVGVSGNDVIVVSIKPDRNWLNCGNRASRVGGFDSEEIRDNFNFKASYYLVGTIYF